ncbi:hypothetical protein G6038_24980 [Rhodococcus sp. 14C212]|uniref:hypothetical protein n=1 Tax=Rhodococcus sp. 14C212 TaxID=2711209 RepID=UPI0013ED62EA|nr:hypothetical protein [Rhodococcus sp. 14C212]NGP08664.1 hypothetical protein [Rhodococcus sp. 14C212]
MPTDERGDDLPSRDAFDATACREYDSLGDQVADVQRATETVAMFRISGWDGSHVASAAIEPYVLQLEGRNPPIDPRDRSR